MAVVHKSNRIEWPMPKIARFQALDESVGWLHCWAAKEVGIPCSTATKWLKKDTDQQTGKMRSGRPPMISQDEIEAIDKWFPGYYEHQASDLQETIKHFNLCCSQATLF